MVSLFIRSALFGTLAGLPSAAVVGGLFWAILHGHDLFFAGGCALLILFSAALSPWGLLLACGCGTLGVLLRSVSDRLPRGASAVPLHMGLCFVVWIAPMALYRMANPVAPTAEGIREMGGKPEILYPYCIGLACLAGAMASAVGVAFQPRKAEPRASATLHPSIGWLTFGSGLLLFLGAYLLLWGLAPLYQRRFDT